jgi:GR25 family glycosyltransferase involved in LPS biosynthesis
MIFDKIFDHIYVINLKNSIDRKEHIKKEFERVGIKKYDFFEATNHNSDEVKYLIDNNLVKTFPNCFRCNQNRCNCENNFLTNFQLGNWCSFINIFKDIIKNNYKFVLICEDDIVFSFQYDRIINNLLSKESFNYYNINMNLPLLIRMGTAFRSENHNSNAKPIFLKNFALCNPCFAINKQMAIIYLKYLKIIDYHSDVYFHQRIPKNVRGIQHFTMFPYPVYELSFVKSKQKFISEVRPLNAYRRMEYKEYFFLTSNILLQIFLLKLFNNPLNKLDIKLDKIGYNGNIDTYIFLNDSEQKRYFFQNKIYLYDSNKELNNNIILKFIHLSFYNKYYKLLQNNSYEINFENKNNIIEKYNELQENIINKKDKINYIKIDINNINEVYNVFHFINKSILNKYINEYQKQII